jgi:hypothetical protein
MRMAIAGMLHIVQIIKSNATIVLNLPSTVRIQVDVVPDWAFKSL